MTTGRINQVADFRQSPAAALPPQAEAGGREKAMVAPKSKRCVLNARALQPPVLWRRARRHLASRPLCNILLVVSRSRAYQHRDVAPRVGARAKRTKHARFRAMATQMRLPDLTRRLATSFFICLHIVYQYKLLHLAHMLEARGRRRMWATGVTPRRRWCALHVVTPALALKALGAVSGWSPYEADTIPIAPNAIVS